MRISHSRQILCAEHRDSQLALLVPRAPLGGQFKIFEIEAGIHIIIINVLKIKKSLNLFMFCSAAAHTVHLYKAGDSWIRGSKY